MKTAKRLGWGIFLVVVCALGSLVSVLSSTPGNVTIMSSGILTATSPLHTEGRYIKDSSGSTVILRGIWKPEYLDLCNGWWDKYSFLSWNESIVRLNMATLRDQWHINVICIEIWGDWWLTDASTSLNGYPTDTSYKWSIKETLRLAQLYGLYVHIRLYSPSSTEGRVESPYAPYSKWTVNDFVNFWGNVASELKDYPNAIFGLYDEPVGDWSVWANVAEQAIAAIRNTGANQLIVVHWAYCGDCFWIEKWMNASKPTFNIVFSNHIYRFHGTFAYNPNSPTDIEYIRKFLAYGSNTGSYDGAGYLNMTETYNVPIWVSAIGSSFGETDNDEYVCFRNTLAVLNEWSLGYAVWQWFKTAIRWSIQYDTTGLIDPPNRVGKAFIDANLGVPVPPTHLLVIDSNLQKVNFCLNSCQLNTPYSTSAFEGMYAVSVPSSKKLYTHNPLFGKTDIGDGAGGYYSYLYASGPYRLNQSTFVSAINMFANVSGMASVAIYGESGGNPNNLVVASAREVCSGYDWYSFRIPDTQLLPGNYFLVMKIETSGMLIASLKPGSGVFRTYDCRLPFPSTFGTVEGHMDVEYSIYVPLGPIQTTTYVFNSWENNLTSPDRTLYLASNMTLIATYKLQS